MDSKNIIELEKQYIMQTYGRFNLIIDKGKGCYLFDKDGNRYLDLVGGLATASIGYGNKEFAEALSEQAEKLVNATNLFYTEQQAVLAEKLAKLSGLKKSFFSNSGSEANEVAIKLARKYTKNTEIISTEKAFHGRTFGALTATWNKKYKDYCRPLVPDFKHVPYNDAEALEKAVTGKTAAFIVEPIQGESGIIVPDDDYLKQVREICDKKNILFIADEIQTNMRTGKFFAYQHNKVLPDIATVAKGIAGGVPIGITIAKKEVADAFEKGEQGSTFGGNSLSCAAANFVIDLAMKNKLIDNAKNMGDYFFKRLNDLDKNSIKEARGKGLMLGVELNKESKKVVELCLKKKLLVNKCTDSVIRFLPALIIKEKEIDEAIDILASVFEGAG